jgi:7-cyano-7-deazaguanine synthase in queuosine biosynthesis
VLGASDLFIGVNAVDYSGYPDCRPEFIQAFERLADLATRAGVEGRGFRIHAPLQHWSKKQIVEKGTELGVDFAQTVSCYSADDQGVRAVAAIPAGCAPKASSPPESLIRLDTPEIPTVRGAAGHSAMNSDGGS